MGSDLDISPWWFHLCVCRSDCRVVEAFVRLLEEMWTGRSSSCAPVEATTALFSVLPQFNDQSQHDAQELLLFLLNALHDDLQKVQPNVPRKYHPLLH